MQDASEEVTAAHAAMLTGLSERTIRRKIASGEIPARHIARNRYAIRVGDLPIQHAPQDILARIESVENRVRVLELQFAQLAARALSPADPPTGADATPDDPHTLADAASTVAAGTTSPLADPTELQQLLAQLARETQRLAPLMTALMTSQPAPRQIDAREGPTGDATRGGERETAAR